MRPWLVTALAASVLLGDGQGDRVAPPVAAAQASCPRAAPLDQGACAEAALSLAEIAGAAYADDPATTVPARLHPAALPGLMLPGGRFTNGSASALVTTAVLNGDPVLVVGFGGSDNEATWLADLRDIDAAYFEFGPLVRAIERYAATGGWVILAGHSAGGTMVQLFMYAHHGDDHYRAITFGSPGALPRAQVFAAEADPRITNFIIADDPFVFLGEHRAEVAAYARWNRVYALALAGEIARESGLTLPQIAGSERYLTADYLNNGARILLPARRSGLSIKSVIRADPDEHEIATYLKRLLANGEAASDLVGN